MCSVTNNHCHYLLIKQGVDEQRICAQTRLSCVITIFLWFPFHKVFYTMCHQHCRLQLQNPYQIMIIFDTNIPDTTGHQMTIQVSMMTSYVCNFCTKNCQSLIILLQVTITNVGNPSSETHCTTTMRERQ